MASESDYGSITGFLLRLAEDENLLCQWALHRRKALADQGLSPEDEELLVSGDFQQLRARIQEENAGEDPLPLMLFLMR
jgi:hypothetical protein